MSIKTELIIILIYFCILYIIAFACNFHYKSDSDILGITKEQWSALFILWLPIWLALFK